MSVKKTAYVLMTALPPTKGHFNLIKFAYRLADRVVVIVCTQPDEPFTYERSRAITQACAQYPNIEINLLKEPLEQNPDAEGFWPMWVKIMRRAGFEDGDYCVTSEPYGQTMAKLLNGIFIPYDIDRRLYYTKATNIRNDLAGNFSDILRSFQPVLRKTVTIFGAESTGKTTLSHELSIRMNGHWLFEYARPYLETVGPEITVDSMTAIWKGQMALQSHAQDMYDKPWVVQDTDLFTTVGYWEQPHWSDQLGPVPDGLRIDAERLKSDLYIFTQSNIPFEKDSIRYGDGVRESTDEYWLSVLEKNNLNYRILNSHDRWAREWEAEQIMADFFKTESANKLHYERQHNG